MNDSFLCSIHRPPADKGFGEGRPVSRCILIILLPALLFAVERETRPRGRRWWLVSVAALVGAHVLDTASSYGRREANLLLRTSAGRFNARSAGIKAGIVGGVLAVQYLALRKAPEAHGPLAITNFAGSGAMAAIAARNWQSRRGATLTLPRN
jgi:hypothetical protein